MYKKRTRRAKQDWRKFPMTGITPSDLALYFAWLDRTGKVPGARFCTELEWEYAGRGIDGRIFPHGKPTLAPDDANFDLTYSDTKDLKAIDEVGTHPASASPFGLLDMSGNSFEWLLPERGEGHIVRSGSYYHDRKTVSLVNRTPMGATSRSAILGARVCATPR